MSTIIARGKKEWFRGWQTVILMASAIHLVEASNVGDVYYVGDYENLLVILATTDAKTDAGDTLDVKIDGSWDNVTFYNMGEFTQKAGNAANVTSEMMQFRAGAVVADPDALLVITADAGAAVTRPSMCPPFLRITDTVTETNDASHTFSVKAYVQ